MVNLDGSPVQVKFDFTMQGRTKQFSDTFGIGIQLRGFALGRWSSGMTLPLHPFGNRKKFWIKPFPKRVARQKSQVRSLPGPSDLFRKKVYQKLGLKEVRSRNLF